MPTHRFFGNESVRLSALLIGLFAASALLLGATSYFMADRAMRAELTDAISAQEGAVIAGFQGEGLSEAIEVVHQLTAVPGLAGRYLLQDASGHRLAGNLAAMPAHAGVFEFTVPGGGPPDRRLVLGRGRLLADGTYLFVGESGATLARTRGRMLHSLAWIIGATMLLAVACGATLSLRFLARIDAITRTCRAIVAGRLGERIAVGGSNAQLDGLAGTVNDMLDRIAGLLESLRQISSDIAHDLRTPLTRLRQRLDATRERRLSADEYRAVIDATLGDCNTILAIFAALLRISQIESGMRLAAFTTVDLEELLREVVAIFAPVAEDAGQGLSAQLVWIPPLQADRTLLLQLFSNLVENAIRHAGPGAAIRLQASCSGTEARVTLTDSGPGIPAIERNKVFGRLYRLERSRSTPGNGLGLALVAAIAGLHQYTVELEDAVPGLRVVIRIPLAHAGAAGISEPRGIRRAALSWMEPGRS